MASVKYYKKFSPRNPVVINNGQHALEFDTLDATIGYYATDDAKVQEQFLEFMKQQRYGISEVSAEEFHRDYVEKKRALNGSPAPRWREEIQSSFKLVGNEIPGAEASRAALAVSGRATDIKRNVAPQGPPIRMESLANAPTEPAPKQLGEQQPKETFVPTLGRRKLKS
jgi:hypothetical protein